MKNKKGFTLIELLAVIVILAIIALIAVPIVLNIINNTKESSAIRSTEIYFDSVEKTIVAKQLSKESNVAGTYEIKEGNLYQEDELKYEIKMKGTKPTGESITINKTGKIENAKIIIDGYLFNYSDGKLSRSLRDFSIISIVPQVIFFILSFIRTIGFNIKKFNFQSDLKEMSYGFEDSEEIEVNINLNSYKYKRSIRRSLREFIYYLKENKLFVLIVLSIVAIILVIFIIKNWHINYNKTYSTGKQFTYSDIQFTIEDSIITNLDYNGNILDPNSYYVVLKVSLSNNSGYTREIDFNLFKLTYSDKIIVPTLSDSSYFVDFAPENVVSSFAHRTEKTFALVYKIAKKDINKIFKLDIYNGSVYNKNEYTSKHIYVKLKPKKIGDVSLVGNYKMGEKITFSNTFLENTSIKVNNYEINKSYFYTFEKCFKDSCNVYDDVITVPYTQQRHDNYILTLNTDYVVDENTIYGKGNFLPGTFADYFIKIQYKSGNTIYTDDFINVTPSYTTNFLAFEVNNNINNASVIQAIITIRNKMYIINLKS